MTTISEIPVDYPPEVIGYAEPWIATPGQTVEIKVSSTEVEYAYRVVRLIQSHEGDHAPTQREEVVTTIPGGTCQGRFQLARPGSYAIVDDIGLGSSDGGVEVSLYVQIHLLGAGHEQTIVSTLDTEQQSGFELTVDQSDRLVFRIGSGKVIQRVSTEYEPVLKTWLKIGFAISGRSVSASFTPIAIHAEQIAPSTSFASMTEQDVDLSHSSRLLIGASSAIHQTSQAFVATNFFNGRVDGLTIKALGQQSRLVASYDFSRDMSGDRIIDRSVASRHGKLVNAPTRAVRGHDWDGSETDWTKASHGYGAIHFHEDDMDDARWETDFSIRLPEGARSGAYAVEVRSTISETVLDRITFFARRPQGSTAKVALILSTFTYLAYANEHMWDQSKPSRLEVPSADFSIRRDEDYCKMERRSDIGLSLYDVHRDLSGVVYSSSKRPILNIRPGYVHWAFHRPREFSADLLMIGFLEEMGLDYDVCYDHDLHSDGIAAIRQYNTVLTGCHPEYPSLPSYDAYTEYARSGGNIMYLGGNGFYWMSALDAEQPHRLEVRRGDQGVRTVELPGGERHHSLTGAQGGLWRSRGRAANYLVGVGCCGEGLAPGVPYKRTQASSDPAWSWAFEGISQDELLGEYGFGGGASGDEIDRFDLKNGSPSNTVVLASSTGHSDEFGLFPEDSGFPMINTLGTQTDRIRSDITIYETSGGGHVFAVGSINWYSSLGWDGYKNNIARLTKNVLLHFIASPSV